MSDRKPSAGVRRAVFERAGGRCEYCGCPANHSSDYFSVEHIYPRVLGGTNDLDNLALACQGCNSHKSTHTDAIDPVDGGTAPLYHPRRHVWSDHFEWSEDLEQIVGLTPTGRATIEALHLNREGVVNLRRVLRPGGKHPSNAAAEEQKEP